MTKGAPLVFFSLNLFVMVDGVGPNLFLVGHFSPLGSSFFHSIHSFHNC